MPSAKSSKKVSSTETTETKTTKQTTPVETTPVVATAPVVATEKPTKTPKTKTTKSEQTTTKEVAPVETTTTTQLENVVVTTDTSSSVNQGFTEFISKFQSMLSQFSSLRSELKTLERQTMKQLKIVEKLKNKKKNGAKRKPSGFVKPAPISDELATFLGKEKGVEMARTDVTREINQYIRTHNLQDKENGRKINPDTALSTLLKITPESDIVLTYFNLQRYMGPHFPKSVKVETTA